MPCHDYGRTEEGESKATIQNRLDDVTRMLCKLCQEFTPEQLIAISPQIGQWYQNHEERDRAERYKEILEKLPTADQMWLRHRFKVKGVNA
jgi:hypothetical protein